QFQDKIDQYYEQELQSLLKPTASGPDSTTLKRLSSFLEHKEKKQSHLQGMISGDASRLLNNIRELLLPLNENQEKLLRKEVALINQNLIRTNQYSIIASVLAILFIIWFAWQTRRSLQKSIQKPVGLLQKLSRGILHEEKIKSNDELNEIIEAGEILRTNLKSASRFALDIGDGKFDSQFQAVSQEDILGNSLLEMRDQLKTVAQEEKNRHWINEGQTQLDVLLRQNDLEEKAYYNQVLSFVMRYTGVNQGAFFLVRNDQEEPFFDMISCIAYERNKFIKRSFEINEGFIGQVYYEKKPLCLEDIPKDYYKITSGLGELSPRRLLFYPLIFNDGVEGVIELANVADFSDLQLEFIKKISDSMAASIANHKNSYKTIALLADSQKLSEELKTSEEELRQNMEEMKATQEEMERRSREFEEKLQVMDSFGLAMIEFTLQGNVYNCNQSFLDLMGYASLDEILGKHHRIFVPEEDQDSHTYRTFWEKLGNGISYNNKFRYVTKDGKEVYLQAYYGGLKDLQGSLSRVFKIAQKIPKSEYTSSEVEVPLEETT
ncbi:MAG: GAF domain-containing protein, partial [Bacteroidota bacterium]